LTTDKETLERRHKFRESNLTRYKRNSEAVVNKLTETTINIEKSQKKLYKLENKLAERQKYMITELSSVFQIEPWNTSLNLLNTNVSQSNLTSGSSNSILNSSRRQRLMIINTTYGSQVNELQNAITFGNIIQAMQILAFILKVPLRYQTISRGSRSFICELDTTTTTTSNESYNQNGTIKISNQQFSSNCYDGIREHTLFKQSSSSDESFHRGIILLNRNILQLRLLYDNYKNMNGRDMLDNLKWLLENSNSILK
jgi:uncharacterized coiled-coil protein SlyX